MDTLKLGGNIELNGFSNLDGGTMVILKKIIGNHVKQLFSTCKNFEKLSLSMNSMNVPEEVERANKKTFYELNGCVVDGDKEFTFKTEASNLFVAVDSVLKNLETNFEMQEAHSN